MFDVSSTSTLPSLNQEIQEEGEVPPTRHVGLSVVVDRRHGSNDGQSRSVVTHETENKDATPPMLDHKRWHRVPYPRLPFRVGHVWWMHCHSGARTLCRGRSPPDVMCRIFRNLHATSDRILPVLQSGDRREVMPEQHELAHMQCHCGVEEMRIEGSAGSNGEGIGI